jgi:hypothetical protein
MDEADEARADEGVMGEAGGEAGTTQGGGGRQEELVGQLLCEWSRLDQADAALYGAKVASELTESDVATDMLAAACAAAAVQLGIAMDEATSPPRIPGVAVLSASPGFFSLTPMLMARLFCFLGRTICFVS